MMIWLQYTMSRQPGSMSVDVCELIGPAWSNVFGVVAVRGFMCQGKVISFSRSAGLTAHTLWSGSHCSRTVSLPYPLVLCPCWLGGIAP
jgi:hypothetical protein